MASAFQTLILPRGSDGVFAPQPGGAGTAVSEQLYPSVPLSDPPRGTGASLAMSGGGTAVSSGIRPSRYNLNGTYNNPIRVSQTTPSANVQSLPSAQQPSQVTQNSNPTSTLCSTQESKPTSALSYYTIASIPTPTPVQLVPTVASQRNPSDPKNIVPQVQISLDYAETGNTDPNKAIRAASVDIAFNLPTVALEHVDSVSSVTCPSNDQMVVTFTNRDLFHKAINSWPHSDFNLVNNADGCGDTPNQRTAFQVLSFKADEKSLTIRATGQMLALNDPNLFGGFTVSFGHHASAEAAPNPATTQAPHKRHGVRGFADIGGAFTSKVGSVGDAITSAVTSLVSTAASKESSATSHIASDVSSATSHVVSDVSSATSHVASQASSVATDVKTAAADLSSEAVNGFSRGGTWTTSLSAGPQATQLNQSPFGQAKKLGNSDGMTIWCVDCGAKGTIELSGEISAGIDSISAGSLNFQALDFSIPLTFGFEAKDTTVKHTLGPYSLFEIPLTPFEVEPFFSVGPKFTFAVDFGVAVSATGNLKAGVNMHWGNASAAMDLVKNDPNTLQMAGWNPDVDKVFEFSGGEMAINASLGVPISFDIGISLLQHNIGKNVSITDTPSVELDSIFHVSGNARRDHARDLIVRDNQCSNGMDETIGFQNIVNVNVVGVWKTQLASFSTPLYSTCITTSTPSSSPSGFSSPSSAPARTTPQSPNKSNNAALLSESAALVASATAVKPTGGTASAGRLLSNSNFTASGSGSQPSGAPLTNIRTAGAYTASSGQNAESLPGATGVSASTGGVQGAASPTNQILQRRRFSGLEHVVRENKARDIGI